MNLKYGPEIHFQIFSSTSFFTGSDGKPQAAPSSKKDAWQT
jgi:hypothetical protein